MNILRVTAYILTLVGALNWGLVGLLDFDLVAAIFGEMSILTRILYTTVGISAVITVFLMHHCERIEDERCDEYGRCNL